MEDIKNYKLPPVERLDDATDEEIVNHIKENLKDNYSVTLWTWGLSQDEINYDEKMLTDAGIVHYHDTTINGFNCFNTEEEMNNFRKKVLDVIFENIE